MTGRRPDTRAIAGPQSRPMIRPLAAALALAIAPAAHAESSVLWHLVHDQCVPHALAHEPPAPCAEVVLPDGKEESGHAILKDRRGELQFLLIPTRRSSGIDDPALLQPGAPPYWSDAWDARHFVDALHGKPVPRDRLSLAINSAIARSQDQLHIHLSCVREDLRARLLAAQGGIDESWKPLEGGWLGHPYWVRRVAQADLHGIDPFRDVADHVPEAGKDMGHETIGIVAATFSDGREGFFVLAGRVSWLAGALGSGEHDVQDHDCAVLK